MSDSPIVSLPDPSAAAYVGFFFSALRVNLHDLSFMAASSSPVLLHNGTFITICGREGENSGRRTVVAIGLTKGSKVQLHSSIPPA